MFFSLLEIVRATLVTLTAPSIRIVGPVALPVRSFPHGSPRAISVASPFSLLDLSSYGASGSTGVIFDEPPTPALASPRVMRWVKNR